MDYLVLWNEIANDPLGRGYVGMSDTEIAVDINTEYRTLVSDILDSAAIFENTDMAEFQAKTDLQKQFVRDIWGLGSGVRVGPGSKARAVYVQVFGAQSATVQALAAALEYTASRAAELGLGLVYVTDIEIARQRFG